MTSIERVLSGSNNRDNEKIAKTRMATDTQRARYPMCVDH